MGWAAETNYTRNLASKENGPSQSFEWFSIVFQRVFIFPIVIILLHIPLPRLGSSSIFVIFRLFKLFTMPLISPFYRHCFLFVPIPRFFFLQDTSKYLIFHKCRIFFPCPWSDSLPYSSSVFVEMADKLFIFPNSFPSFFFFNLKNIHQTNSFPPNWYPLWNPWC